jgi:hypothetical protein
MNIQNQKNESSLTAKRDPWESDEWKMGMIDIISK